MRVLGVDPGLSRCGVGVVDGPCNRPVAVRAGVVSTPAGQPVAARLATLHEAVTGLLAQAEPDVVAVERVFFNANVRTAMGVGQAAGVVLLAAAQAGIGVVEYTPTQVKVTVTGDGAAGKEQVGYMVAAQLRLAAAPRPPDAADALALALCHLQRGGQRAGGADMAPRLAAAAAAAGPGAQVQRRSSQRGAGAERNSGGGGPGSGERSSTGGRPGSGERSSTGGGRA